MLPWSRVSSEEESEISLRSICAALEHPLKARMEISLKNIVLFCGTGFHLKVRMRVPLRGNVLLCNTAPSET